MTQRMGAAFADWKNGDRKRNGELRYVESKRSGDDRRERGKKRNTGHNHLKEEKFRMIRKST